MANEDPYRRAEDFLPPADEPGIDGYELHEMLGEGGSGRVYRARQAAYDRDVAIKVLAASGFRDGTARRFERECRAVGALSSHPNIVTIYDSGVTRFGRPYIVMDHMSRGSLGDLLQRGTPSDWTEAVATIIKVSGAVETAHRSGILHRDIKPENILLSAFSEPKLADFGIASIPGGYQTHTGAITASLFHAAPEVLEGHKPTRAVDIYALGSTLFALIAGRAAFETEEGAGLQSLIATTLTRPVPDLRPDGVPDAVCNVIETAMAKDPASRFASADDLGIALQRAQAEAGIPATDLPVPAPAGHVITYATDLADTSEGSRTSIRERRELTPPLPSPPKRRFVWRSPITAGVVALVLLGSGTGVVALRSRRAEIPAPAAAPAGSAETERVSEEDPGEATTAQEPRAKRRQAESDKRKARRTSSVQGRSYSYAGGGGDGSAAGSGGGYVPAAGSGSGSTAAGEGGSAGTGGSSGSTAGSNQKPPPPPPNEQPATLAFYHYWDDDGRYLFTADQAIADDQRSRYGHHEVVAAVWAARGEGLAELCPAPERCPEGYISKQPPKKGSYKALYFYVGEHGRFFTTDRSTIPSGTATFFVGYAR